MADPLRLMCILAHPDDEAYGMGAILAKYAAEGVETYLLTATRGQRGWPDSSIPFPGEDSVGNIREAELKIAAGILGLRQVELLNYTDGELDNASPAEIIHTIAEHIRFVKPQVVVTFSPNGTYGHPDHIAVSQFAAAAVMAAACPGGLSSSFDPFKVLKMYFMAETRELMDHFTRLAGDIETKVDGVVRKPSPWEDWEVTTRVDAVEYSVNGWEAIKAHASQLAPVRQLLKEPVEVHQALWGSRTFYRVFSLVNGGRKIETDLFEGIRVQ